MKRPFVDPRLSMFTNLWLLIALGAARMLLSR